LCAGSEMDVVHRHLDLAVTGELARGRNVNAGHGHTGERGIAEVVETEVRRDLDFAHCCFMRFAHAAEPMGVIPGNGKEPS